MRLSPSMEIIYSFVLFTDPIITTSFIIETCHEAAAHASYSRRQKIKVDDFTFALRKDPAKLGRVQELVQMDKHLKTLRKVFNENDDKLDKAEVEKMVEDDFKGPDE